MELTPEWLRSAAFEEARKGYDTAEVDEFIEEAAAGAEDLHRRLQKAVLKAKAAEDRIADAERRTEAAEARAAGVTESGGEGASKVDEEVETLKRTLLQAQRFADHLVAEARRDAKETIEAAKREGNRHIAEAETARTRALADIETHRTRSIEGIDEALKEEVTRLHADRSRLEADVRTLQQWLDTERARLKSLFSSVQSRIERESELPQAPKIDHIALPGEGLRVAQPPMPGIRRPEPPVSPVTEDEQDQPVTEALPAQERPDGGLSQDESQDETTTGEGPWAKAGKSVSTPELVGRKVDSSTQLEGPSAPPAAAGYYGGTPSQALGGASGGISIGAVRADSWGKSDAADDEDDDAFVAELREAAEREAPSDEHKGGWFGRK